MSNIKMGSTKTMAGGRGYEKGKLKQLILFVARRCMNDPTFGSTKLNKILWYSDFEAFRTLGQSITGAKYQHLPEGPALVAMMPVIREMEDDGWLREVPGAAGPKHRRAVPLIDEDLSDFSAKEVGLVSEYIAEFWAMSAGDVSDVSHEAKAWRLTHDGQEIPYSMAVLSLDDPTAKDLDWLAGVAGGTLGA